jgi:hypothetical protein
VGEMLGEILLLGQFVTVRKWWNIVVWLPELGGFKKVKYSVNVT